jgi:hypothetical protein
MRLVLPAAEHSTALMKEVPYGDCTDVSRNRAAPGSRRTARTQTDRQALRPPTFFLSLPAKWEPSGPRPEQRLAPDSAALPWCGADITGGAGLENPEGGTVTAGKVTAALFGVRPGIPASVPGDRATVS